MAEVGLTQADAFEAVCDALGWDYRALTATSKAVVGKVAKELREAGASADEIRYVPTAWNRLWGEQDTPTLTATAIAAHWPAMHSIWESHLRAKASAAEQRAREQRELEGFVEILDDDGNPRYVEPLPLETNRELWRRYISGKKLLRDI